jgi:hypothetical protein
MAPAKHYASTPGHPGPYKVGQEVRLKGRGEELFTVTAVGEGSITVRGQDGESVTVRLGAPMAKAAGSGPRLLLKAAPRRQGEKGQKGAEAGKAEAKRQEGEPKGDGAQPGKPSMPKAQRPQPAPMRGTPEGEPEMQHHDRVRFQHGKVAGEGEIVASGPDGVRVVDDAGREHTVRHENLIGSADDAGKSDAPSDPGTETPEQEAAEDAQTIDEAVDAVDVLKDMEPSKLKKMLAALKFLAPLFGDSPAKKAQDAKKAAPPAQPAKPAPKPAAKP